MEPTWADFDNFTAADGAQLGFRQHVFEHGDQFLCEPIAETAFRHAIVPDQRALFFLDETAWCSGDEVVQNRTDALQERFGIVLMGLLPGFAGTAKEGSVFR